MVDGPGLGNDHLFGNGKDDGLFNNSGKDELLGQGGSDLIVSTSVCDNDTLNGGGGQNNASWAQFRSPAEGPGRGVHVSLADSSNNNAGAYNPGASNPWCPTEGAQDHVSNFQFLEGSGAHIVTVSDMGREETEIDGKDVLIGDGQNNIILGRSGKDYLHGGAGVDIMLANNGDVDGVIDCGPDGAVARIDFRNFHKDGSASTNDPNPVDCVASRVRPAAPTNLRADDDAAEEDGDATQGLDELTIASTTGGSDSAPDAFFPLDETPLSLLIGLTRPGEVGVSVHAETERYQGEVPQS